MRIKEEELQVRLESHREWLLCANNGEQFNLKGCDHDLSDFDLSGQDLSYGNLAYANLCQIHLEGANLEGADLTKANLGSAKAAGANFRKADLSDACLRSGNFTGADFTKAKLIGANLDRAGLKNANFYGADLLGTVLRHTDVRGANFEASAFPLWFGTLGMFADERLASQLAYQFCSLKCYDEQFLKARNELLKLANKSQMVEKRGKLKKIEFGNPPWESTPTKNPWKIYVAGMIIQGDENFETLMNLELFDEIKQLKYIQTKDKKNIWICNVVMDGRKETAVVMRK